MKNSLRAAALTISFLVSPIMASAAPSSSAEGNPDCTSKNVGIHACFAQKDCECAFQPKSEMKGTPDRFGWDCGINRGPCLDYKTIDNSKPYDGPSSVGLDKSSTVIHP